MWTSQKPRRNGLGTCLSRQLAFPAAPSFIHLGWRKGLKDGKQIPIVPGYCKMSVVAASDLDEAFERWRSALIDALDSPGNVLSWQERRYKLADQVGQILVSAAPSSTPLADHVVYGVYVSGSGLLYVGQTEDAKRRLRDLPIGESHHLATTVPPEIWERVIVIQWTSLLPRISAQEAQAAERLGPLTCGLAIEHLLQVAFRPVLNSRRRSANAGWVTRNIESSRSRGAVASSQLPELFSNVRSQWDMLASAEPRGDGNPVIYMDCGRVVFPGIL